MQEQVFHPAPTALHHGRWEWVGRFRPLSRFIPAKTMNASQLAPKDRIWYHIEASWRSKTPASAFAAVYSAFTWLPRDGTSLAAFWNRFYATSTWRVFLGTKTSGWICTTGTYGRPLSDCWDCDRVFCDIGWRRYVICGNGGLVVGREARTCPFFGCAS